MVCKRRPTTAFTSDRSESPQAKCYGDRTAYGVFNSYNIQRGADWLVVLNKCLNVYSLKIVSWSMCPSNDRQMVCDASRMAIGLRHPKPRLILLSDRGNTFASQDFRDTIAEHGILQSMSYKSDYYDYVSVESWNITLKREAGAGRCYQTREAARIDAFNLLNSITIHVAAIQLTTVAL